MAAPRAHAPARRAVGGLAALLVLASAAPSTARPPPRLEVVAPRGVYDFGALLTYTTSEPIIVDLRTPPGADPVTITAIDAEDPAILVDTSMVRNPITAGQTTRFGMLFHPTRGGPVRAQVHVRLAGVDGGSDGGSGGVVSVVATGVGVEPDIELVGADGTPPALELPAVPVGETSAPRELRVRNRGAFPVELLRVESSDGQYTVEQGRGGALPAGGSLAVRVRFSPSRPGPAPATLAVRLRRQPQPSARCAVTGVGLERRGCGGCRAGARRGAGAFDAAAPLALLLSLVSRRWRWSRGARCAPERRRAGTRAPAPRSPR